MQALITCRAVVRESKQIILVCLIALGWSFIGSLGSVVPAAFGMQIDQTTDSYTLFCLYAEIIGILAVTHYYRRKQQPELTPFAKNRALPDYLWGAGIGLLTFTLIWIVIWVGGGFRVTNLLGNAHGGLLVLYLGGYMVQSMFEETLCRGYVMGYWLRRQRLITAFLVNTGFFTLMHSANPGFDWRAAGGIFLFGLCMSMVRYVTHTLWMVGAIHALWNFAEGVIFGTNVSGTAKTARLLDSTNVVHHAWLNGGTFGVERSLPVLIVLSLFAIVALLVIRRGKPVAQQNG